MLTPIKRKKLPCNIRILCPNELTRAAHTVLYLKPLKWGFFKKKRNIAREAKVKAAWDKIESYVDANFIQDDDAISIYVNSHYVGRNSFFTLRISNKLVKDGDVDEDLLL